MTTLDEITERIRGRFGENSGLDASIKFDFGTDGVVHVDAASIPNVVSNEDKGADCTIAISLADFEDLIKGELNPTMAFMMGKLKVDGSMAVAMKLANVL